jgi:acyl-CoA thioester hydrolase
MNNHHEALSGFPVVIRVPVLWGDLDAFDHVNNTVYLRWCETARVEYLIRIGLWPSMPPAGLGPILASISCEYRRPVNHPDAVYISARVTGIGNTSFRMEHTIVSETQNVLVAESNSTIVVLDYRDKKPVPVPAEMRKAIAELEGRSEAALAIRR